MTYPPLMTHEIGSLAKPSWKVKASAGTLLNDDDISAADTWGDILDIEGKEELLQLLKKRSDFTHADKQLILHFASLYAIRFQEKAGLDIVWDGEQHRVEMYEYPIRRIKGFNFRGHVRSFDNKYYHKASCVGRPDCEDHYHVHEYEAIASQADKPVKIPITGAYTLVDWSFDEHYCADVHPGLDSIAEARQKARHRFLEDISKRIIYPNLKALANHGAAFLQIDEPAATTKKNEIDAFIESVRHSIGDLAGKAFFSAHICFSEYKRLFPAILQLQGVLDEIHLEYANRDSRELGTSRRERPGYDILDLFKDNKFVVGLGVLDVHTDFIEPPELVRDRILYACDVLKDPSRIFVAPDCGLRTRTWEVAFQKLRHMVEGRNLAIHALGLD